MLCLSPQFHTFQKSFELSHRQPSSMSYIQELSDNFVGISHKEVMSNVFISFLGNQEGRVLYPPNSAADHNFPYQGKTFPTWPKSHAHFHIRMHHFKSSIKHFQIQHFQTKSNISKPKSNISKSIISKSNISKSNRAFPNPYPNQQMYQNTL